jgi:hypothetical protein
VTLVSNAKANHSDGDAFDSCFQIHFLVYPRLLRKLVGPEKEKLRMHFNNLLRNRTERTYPKFTTHKHATNDL